MIMKSIIRINYLYKLSNQLLSNPISFSLPTLPPLAITKETKQNKRTHFAAHNEAHDVPAASIDIPRLYLQNAIPPAKNTAIPTTITVSNRAFKTWSEPQFLSSTLSVGRKDGSRMMKTL